MTGVQTCALPISLEAFNFTLKTFEQAFRIQKGDLQSYSPDLYFLNAELLANDQLTYNEAKELLSATVGGKKVSVKFQSNQMSNRFAIVFDSLPRTDEEQTLEVKWDASGVKKENLLPFSFTLPKKGVFEVVNVRIDENSANRVFSVNFSDPLDKNQDFEGLVTLSGVSQKYSVNGNVLKVMREEVSANADRKSVV